MSLKKSKITNERQLIMKEFLDRLNAERGKYPPIKPARLGVMCRYMDTSQMKQFLGECKYANNFSKFFWWKMNPIPIYGELTDKKLSEDLLKYN